MLPQYLNSGKITLSLGDPGGFPDLKRPRVLFIALLHDSKILDLKKSIDSCLYSAGFPEEKRSFAPHLTIGRVRKHSYKEIQFPPVEKLSFEISKVILFKSELKRTGSVHTPLKTFDL